jgi:hypothetical protein
MIAYGFFTTEIAESTEKNLKKVLKRFPPQADWVFTVSSGNRERKTNNSLRPCKSCLNAKIKDESIAL